MEIPGRGLWAWEFSVRSLLRRSFFCGVGKDKGGIVSEELIQLEHRLNERIDDLKKDMKQSLRTVHDRVDEVYKELGAIPGQVLAAIGPQLQAKPRNDNGQQQQPKQWHESVPWKWVTVGGVFLGILLLVATTGLDPENIREVVTILREEATP